MAETFAAEIIISARDLATPALTETQRSLERTAMVARGAQAETLAMGRGMNEAEGLVRTGALGIERGAGVTDAAFTRMGAGSDRWATDYRAAALDLGLSTDMIGDDMRRMARETGRSTDSARDEMGRFVAGTRRAGDQTGESTGFMQRAWRGLDIVDDIGGVIGMIDGLTRRMREMATEAIGFASDVELSMARISSLQTGYAGGAGGELAIAERGQVAEASYAFARGEGLGDMIPLGQTEYIQRTKEARSAGLGIEAAMALTERSALLGVGAEGTTSEAAELLRPLYNIMGDKAADPMEEIARLTDQVAATQAQFDIPALGALTEAVSTAATLARERGLPTEVMLSSIGAFFQGGKSGSEAGEALNSALEEIVGGMEELGSSVVRTAKGYLDLPATLDVIRGLDLGDPTDRATMMQDAFGELGSVALALLSGSQYEALKGGIGAIQDSEGVAMERAEPVAATRAFRVERLAVREELASTLRGQDLAGLDDVHLTMKERSVERNITAQEVEERAGGGFIGRLAGEGYWWLELLDLIPARARAIPETLATGLEAGGPALGAAMEAMLGREVTPRLAQSDAEIGPLSRLTASGRAIPETLAAGVLESQGLLGAVLSGALTLPELAELRASFGQVAPPLLPESPLAELPAAFGDVAQPLLPQLSPLLLEVLTGDAASPLLPQLSPLLLEVLTGEATQPFLPQLSPLLLEVLTGDAASPLLPQLSPLLLEVLTGEATQPFLPQLSPLLLEVLTGDAASPLLPQLSPLLLEVLTGEATQPFLPQLSPLLLEVLTGDAASPLLPQLSPLLLEVLTGEATQPFLPQLSPLLLEVLTGDAASPLLPQLSPLLLEVLTGDAASPLLPQLSPLLLEVLTGEATQPFLPQLSPLLLEVLTGDAASPLLPQLSPLLLEVLTGDAASPLLPQLSPLLLEVLTGEATQPFLPQLSPLLLEVLTGDVASPLLPQLSPLLLEVLTGEATQPFLPQLSPLLLEVLTGDAASPLLPQLSPLLLEVLTGDVASPLLPQLSPLLLEVLTGEATQPFLPQLSPLLPLLGPPALSPTFGDLEPPLLAQSAPALTALLPALLGAPSDSDPELLRALRDLVDELRAARATGRGGTPAAGGGVKIERLDLHVRDDLLHTLSDLHHLLGRR